MNNYSTFLHPLRWAGVLCAALLLALAPFKAQADISVEIMCSPSAVVMKSAANGDWMTVHTDLAYSSVDTASVELDVNNGQAILSARATKADDCGNLVAKFSLTELKGLVAPPSAILTLTGSTKDGEMFAGSDTVVVRAGK